MKLTTCILTSSLLLLMASYRHADVPPVTRDTVKPIKSQKISKGKYNHVDTLISLDNGTIVIYKGANGKRTVDTVYGRIVTIKEVDVVIQDGRLFKPYPRAIPDTTIKPTYEYVYKTTIPINQLQPTLDTINMIMENFGIDMMGSRSKALKELFNQKIGVLLGRIVVDSVKVVK